MNRKTEIKIYLTFWVIVVTALMLITIYQCTAISRDFTRIAGSIKAKLPSILLIGGAAQIFLTRTIHKMKKNMEVFIPGSEAERKTVIAINSGIKSLARIFLIVNSIGFFLGPTVTIIIYHFIGIEYQAWETFFMVSTHVFAGIVVYNLQYGILNMVTFNLLDSFQIHEAYPELKTRPTARRRVLIVLAILSSFVFLTAGQAYGIMNSISLGNIDLSTEFSNTIIGTLIQTALIGCLFLLVFYIRSAEEQKQLDQLQQSMKTNLSTDTNEYNQINIVSHDDYGLLATAVNEFTFRLAFLVENIKKAGETVGVTSKDLQQSIETSEASLEKMQAVNSEMSGIVKIEQDTMETVSVAISEITESISIVGSEVSNHAAFVEQSSAAISEMSSNINSVAQISQKALKVTDSLSSMIIDGSTRLSETVSSIDHLNESSEKVQSIVKVIQKISAQTNLLAMNAAIEAAHAGDAGSGFSVVADEVRKLAEESGKSANEIRNIIVEMTSAINSGVDTTGKTKQAFTLITKGVEDTSQIINTVSSAMDEQQSAADEIMTAMGSIVEVSEKLKVQVDDQLKRSNLMNSSFADLTHAMTELEDKSSEQQNEDKLLTETMSSLRSVSRRNSEAVEHLEKTVGNSK